MKIPYHIAIEGTIGVGKTSLAKILGERLGAKLVIEEGMSRGWEAKDNLSTFMLAEERAGIEVRE